MSISSISASFPAPTYQPVQGAQASQADPAQDPGEAAQAAQQAGNQAASDVVPGPAQQSTSTATYYVGKTLDLSA